MKTFRSLCMACSVVILLSSYVGHPNPIVVPKQIQFTYDDGTCKKITQNIIDNLAKENFEAFRVDFTNS
jgi:hypothetical protein